MKRKLLMVVGLVGAMGVGVMANPLYQEVKAIFNPTLQYELDGEEVLQGKGGLVYQDKVYLPIRDVATILGIDVEYKDKTVILKNKVNIEEKPEIKLPIAEEKLSEDFKGTVLNVDLENSRITILNDKDIEIVLNVSKETSFFGKHGDITDKRLYNIQDLKEGMEISGSKSQIETASFPAQSAVYVINIEIGEQTTREEDFSIDFKGTVLEVNEKNNQILVLLENDNEVVLNVSDETKFFGENVDKNYSMKDIEEGTNIYGTKSTIATFSLPPQSPVYVINIITNK